MTEISITNNNFPKLKELLASYNGFKTGKHFTKLESLKLLDLSNNLLEEYEEIICLAFMSKLMVLNLSSNPLSNDTRVTYHEMDFEETISKLIP